MHTQNYDENAAAWRMSLVGLALVAVSVAIALWWWTHGVWGNFSWAFLENAATTVGYDSAERPVVGVEPEAAAKAAPLASAEAAAPTTSTATDHAAGAPFCAAGEAAKFVLGFAELSHELGATMGVPLECEHTNPANGDSLQQTSTGLAVYRPSTGKLSFTDGWRHWARTPAGLVAWEGENRPPAQNSGVAPSTDAANQQTARDSTEGARVAHTDGLGVILRSQPRMDARTPSGVAEGSAVTVLERAGSDWARVRDERSGREGWVPSQYLAPAQ